MRLSVYMDLAGIGPRMSPVRVAPPLVAAAHEARLRWGRALGVGLSAALAVIVLAMVVRPTPPGPTASASASWAVPSEGDSGDSGAGWAYCERLRHAVLSDTFLLAAVRRAAERTGNTPGDWPSPAILRRWLDVEIAPPGEDGRVEVSITCRTEDSTRACRLASALAEETLARAAAEHSQAELASRHAAQAAAEQARKRYEDARARLESFLDNHFAEHRSLAADRAKSKSQNTPAGPRLRPGGTGAVSHSPKAALELNAPSRDEVGCAPSSEPQGPGDAPHLTQNPQWLRLNAELDKFRSELAIMLIERTTAHPAVQDLQRRIRELEGHLESVPRVLPVPEAAKGSPNTTEAAAHMASSGPTQTGSASQAADSSIGGAAPVETALHAEAAEAYRKWKEAWLATAADLEQAESQLRQQWARGWAYGSHATQWAVLRLPQLAVAQRLSSNWSHLGALAVAAGLTAAFGTLLLSAGLDIDLPLPSAAAARKSLPAPVIGVVRVASEPPAAPAGNPRGRKVGLVAAGSLVLAGCIALVAVAL